MKATDICRQAAALVDGDRNKTHGDKAVNFKNIATMWTAYLSIRRDPKAPLTGQDVGYMNSLQKMARTQTGQYNPDDDIDGTGYFACAGELAELAARATTAV